MTLRTVPFNTMPGFRSFRSMTSLRSSGRGISSRGSRAGFSSSFRISSSVSSPMPSSFASAFLSPTFCIRTEVVARGCLFSFLSSASVTEPIACASALPMAVPVLRITTFFSFFTGCFFTVCFTFSCSFADCLISSIVSPVLVRSCSTAP